MSKKITDLTVATTAGLTNVFETVFDPGGSQEQSQQITLTLLLQKIPQLISTSAADPNVANIVPFDPARAAEFYQDPSITIYNRWSWSITNQAWYQYMAP